MIYKLLRRRASTFRRSLFEAFGNDHYSRPALGGLDYKLERFLDFDKGFFVEAGANDGFAQSNTYYFEKLRQWEGILIEPIPKLYHRCKALRKRSRVVNAALVADDFSESTIRIHYADLMSVVENGLGSNRALAKHLEEAVPHVREQEDTKVLEVPARTLTSILDELSVTCQIDLLSLDIEGYEEHALHGLDFSRYRPRFICVEVRMDGKIEGLLSRYYQPIEVLYQRDALKDVLFRAK